MVKNKEDRKDSKLDDLKKVYERIRKKHSLPSFDDMNKDFQIERISEVETEYLIREVRKFMAEKFSNYLRFVEAILHPVNSPMFVFSIIKSIGAEEKNKLTEIYKYLAKTEVLLIELDIDFSEEKEAKFIKESFTGWQKIKDDLQKFIVSIKKSWDNKFEVNHKGYFG
ncbi:MAG: hypothetical protein ACE5ES_01770 [Candidatus Nanoarchaeia archaeon]